MNIILLKENHLFFQDFILTAIQIVSWSGILQSSGAKYNIFVQNRETYNAFDPTEYAKVFNWVEE